MTELEKQKKIADIMTYFDFEKVHKVMKILNWKWTYDAGFEEGLKVPSVLEIKETVRENIERVMETGGYISTGGFTYKFEDDTLSVEFVIEEIEC